MKPAHKLNTRQRTVLFKVSQSPGASAMDALVLRHLNGYVVFDEHYGHDGGWFLTSAGEALLRELFPPPKLPSWRERVALRTRANTEAARARALRLRAMDEVSR